MRTAWSSSILFVAMSLVACGAADDGQTSGRFDESNTSPAKSKPSTSTDDDDSEDGVTNTKGGTKTDSDTPGDDDPTDPNSNSGEASNSCDTARDLGAISGDVDAPQLTAQGTCSEWLRVRVTENDSYPIADDLKVLLTLVSPAGQNFDLFAYVDPEVDTLACETPTGSSEAPAGRSDELALAWGETYTANNSDDSRTVSIEIRSQGACTGGSWTLLVQGNR